MEGVPTTAGLQDHIPPLFVYNALLEALLKGLFEPTRLVDYLRHCITFEEDEHSGGIIKKIGG